jgi:hypothetical protein
MFQPDQISPFQHLARFLLILVMLFPILFIFAGWVFADEICLFAIRKYVEPEVNKEYGFSAENQRFYYGDQPYIGFVLTKVEKGGLMDTAGFRPNDLIYLNVGCRFSYPSKSDEAIFYGILFNLKEGHTRKFEVVKAEDFARAAKQRLDPYEKSRQIFLENRKHYPCGEDE